MSSFGEPMAPLATITSEPACATRRSRELPSTYSTPTARLFSMTSRVLAQFVRIVRLPRSRAGRK